VTSPRRQPNHRLLEARLRTPSPSGSGLPMSRSDLAEAVNAWPVSATSVSMSAAGTAFA